MALRQKKPQLWKRSTWDLRPVRFANVHTQKPLTEEELVFIAHHPEIARKIMTVSPWIVFLLRIFHWQTKRLNGSFYTPIIISPFLKRCRTKQKDKFLKRGVVMIDWVFAYKIFFISIYGTFLSMGILTFIIRLVGIVFQYYGHQKEELKE